MLKFGLFLSLYIHIGKDMLALKPYFKAILTLNYHFLLQQKSTIQCCIISYNGVVEGLLRISGEAQAVLQHRFPDTQYLLFKVFKVIRSLKGVEGKQENLKRY